MTAPDATAAVDVAALRGLLDAATPGPWLVFDMDEGKPADEKVNRDGWWWVWQEARLPYYGGVMDMEKHGGDCDGSPGKCCRSVVGIAEITDGDDPDKERADAALIAAAINALPALLALAEQHAALVEAVEVVAGALVACAVPRRADNTAEQRRVGDMLRDAATDLRAALSAATEGGDR